MNSSTNDDYVKKDKSNENDAGKEGKAIKEDAATGKAQDSHQTAAESFQERLEKNKDKEVILWQKGY